MITSIRWRIAHLRHVVHILFCVSSLMLRASDTVDLFPFFQKNKERLEQFAPQPFELELITYESDVSLSESEFFYLTDFKRGMTVSAHDLLRATSYLFKKRKFSRITFILNDGVQGQQLHVVLTGFLTFARLKLHGVLIGKYRYGQHYLLEPGDPFDKEKHKCSLQNIKQVFRDEGFFDGTVRDVISEDDDTKSVTVDLALERGPRFTIERVCVKQKKEHEQEKAILKKMQDRLTKRLAQKKYSKQLINQEVKSVKQLLASKGFLHIRVQLKERICYTTKTVRLKFAIDFLQKRQFVFFGNRFFSDEQLLDVVLLFGKSARLVPASVLGQEIEREYKEKGFWSVVVETKEEDGRDFFLITEGVRAQIKDVSFKGVQQFSEQQLKKKCFRSVLRARHFNEVLLKKARERVLALYREQGFWDTQILDKQFVCLDGKKQWYKVAFVLEEGPQSYLEAIEIPGFEHLLSRWPFSPYTKTEEPICFNPKIIDEQKQWLTTYLNRKKFANPQIKSNLIADGEDVTLQWNIDQEKKVPFGKTIFATSGKIPFDVVRRQLCYKEGDLFDTELLRQSRDRLRGLDIFDRIHLYPDKPKEQDDSRDILLKLRLDDPFELRMRTGFGLQQVSRKFPLGRGVTYKLGGTFLFKNPTNAGDLLLFETDFARAYRNVALEYGRPRFLGIAVRSHCKFYANRYEQPGFIGCKKNLYEVSQTGFLIGLRDVCRWFDAGCNIGIEWMRTDIKEGMEDFAQAVADAILFDSDLLGKHVPYIFIEPTLIVDNLDNKLNPTVGTFTLLTIKGMFPFTNKYADMYFIKLIAEQSFFASLRQKIVFGLHLRFGHIFHQVFENIMPFERFYLGGANSIRSCQTDMCPPVGCFVDDQGNKCAVPRGGKTSVQANFEVRFPLYGSIGGVLFQDFGTLIGQTETGFELSNLLSATGFGVRYNTPFGPLRFDIGFNWHKSARCLYAWFLTLGHAF